ncbi:MAG: hypothetical protein ABEJ55_05145 [Halanaeroarchaeum sp.]
MTNMRIKLVAEPPETLDAIADVQRAVPLVPGTEDDCCARIMDRVGIPSRDDARTWLSFLRGVGLAEETESGQFVRTRTEPTPDRIATGLLEGIYGAEEVRTILAEADEPLPTAAVVDRFEPHVPEWERARDPDRWRDRWAERIDRLLEWFVLAELAESADTGYRLREDST